MTTTALMAPAAQSVSSRASVVDVRATKSIPTASVPSQRMSADSKAFVLATTTILASIYAASFYVSFEGQRVVASWADLSGGAAMALPIAIDLGMVAFTMWGLVRAERGLEVAKQKRLVLAAVLVSAALNFSHVFVPAYGDGITTQTLIGSVISTIIPLVSYFAAEGIIDLWAKRSKASPAVLRQKRETADAGIAPSIPAVSKPASATQTKNAAPATEPDPAFGAKKSLARRVGSSSAERMAAVARAIEVYTSLGSVNAAAKALGIDRSTLNNALIDGGISTEGN